MVPVNICLEQDICLYIHVYHQWQSECTWAANMQECTAYHIHPHESLFQRIT